MNDVLGAEPAAMAVMPRSLLAAMAVAIVRDEAKRMGSCGAASRNRQRFSEARLWRIDCTCAAALVRKA
jgi:hypothetical protein